MELAEESVELEVTSPKVNVLEALQLLDAVLSTLLVLVELPAKYGSVARTVPLMRDTSKVDVAVTVTVRPSGLVVGIITVPLIASERTGGLEVELVINEVVVDMSPAGSVVFEEEVIVP